MHVYHGRVLAIASTPAPSDAGAVSFVLAEGDGTVLRRGVLPSGVDAAVLVLSDYALLSRPAVAQLQIPRIDLLALSSRLHSAEPMSAEAVLQAWVAGGPGDRTSIGQEDIAALRPHLQARSELSAARDEVLRLISSHLAMISERYLELLTQNGRLLLPVLPVLKKYPTPRALDGNGVIALAQTIDRAVPRQASVVDELLVLADEHPAPTQGAVVAESLLPGDIDRYLTLERQLQTLDHIVYRELGDEAEGSLPLTVHRRKDRFSLYAMGGAELHDRADETREAPDQALGTIAAAFARRTSDERNPHSDYESYRSARQSLQPGELSAETALQLEIAGQHLALSAGKFIDATRHRGACDQLLAESVDNGDIPEHLRVDAELSLAITEVCAVDLIQGFSSLRRAVESHRISAATPELLSEAAGLFSLIIVLFGEYLSYPEVLHLAEEHIGRHRAAGPARAPAHIAEFFLLCGRPDVDPAAFEAARDLADRHSDKTVYRSFFHYAMMLSTYITKDVDVGLQHHAQIKQEGLWARFNRRFDRLSRLAYSIHLAARGEFAASRRELGKIEASYESISDGADYLIQGLFSLRLDLAVGRHQTVVTATHPDGPFGELRIQYVHLRRYLPISLVLRGTALLREGEEELAVECFERATKLSVRGGEWYALLAAETLEYRQWLESLQPAEDGSLPGDLNPELLAAIVSSPVLVQRTLEALTTQQTRILRMLAQDRSAASIASELHITNNTLKSHLRQLYKRLGVRSREQAVLYAEIYGLL